MNRIPYSDNDIALMKELYSTFDGYVADEYNKRAEVKRDPASIRKKAIKLGIYKKYERNAYSDKDIALIKELYESHDGNIAKEFNRRSDVKRNENALRGKANSLGIRKLFHHEMTNEQSEWIKSKIDGHYSIHTCWQEYCTVFPAIDEKIFQRWVSNDLGIKRLKGSTRPIGSVRWERDNKRIKVSNTGDHDKDWPYESHLVWEEHYGEIPEGSFIIHLDGNNKNNSIDNLALIDKRTNMILGKNGWFSKGEITKAGIAYSKLNLEIKDMIKEN